MIEGLGLRLGRWRSSESRLGITWGGDVGEKVHFLADGAAEVIERFTDVGRIVVGFI